MLPFKDSIPSRSKPYVNYFLIALNVGVFVLEVLLGPRLATVFNSFAVTPVDFLKTNAVTFQRILPLFTSIFLHGGILHLAGNMLFLYIFGDNVEDSMGHLRYLFFYLLIGVLASLAHIYTNTNSTVPSIGASGAISGVLGAYILMYPRARIYTLIFLLFFITVIEVPAYVFIGLWFILQLASGFATISSGISQQTGGIAYFAHIGGFIAGFILILFFRKRKEEEYLEYF